ncbi:MAG: helix-turn-helix transcriptional regulator [Planctomycetota bacterium]
MPAKTSSTAAASPFRNLDEELARFGEQLREQRLLRNLAQAELAARADVARSAVQNLESGRGTLETLVRVVRALGREDWLASFGNRPTINPLHLTRTAAKRQRASRSRRGPTKQA